VKVVSFGVELAPTGNLNGHPLTPEWAPFALEMGNLRSLKRELSGARSCSLCAKRHILWLRIAAILDLAPSESCLLQCQKFRSRGYIYAPPELGLTSLGPEVAFFRPKVSCSILFFVLYPSPCLAPVSAHGRCLM
jgi:hypothetical protein